jgi:hypothetical protein
VFSTTKTGRHDIAEILLKVAINTKINKSINFWVIEVHTQGISNLFDETKEACKENETEIRKMKRENIAIKAKLSEMETDIRKFKNERQEMKESLLDLKCRSMKYNLVFTGLKETPYYNTEQKLCGFLGQCCYLPFYCRYFLCYRLN